MTYQFYSIKLIIIILVFSSLGAFAQTACSVSESKQLNFLIGDWEFYTPKGKLLGKNHIKWAEGRCSIEDNWEGEDGLNSHSIMSYDIDTRQWNQIWTDEFGNTIHFSGQFKHNKLTLKAKSQNGKGKTLYHKLVYHKKKNGVIEQVWQTTLDKKKWKKVFDGTFKKKNPCL